MRRLASWPGFWLSAALLLCVPASAAGSGLVKHCGGRVAASLTGVTLTASDIRVTATAYNPVTVQNRRIHPALGCGRARRVLRAFLTAKLHRPLNRCAVPAAQGKGCKLAHGWLCYSGNIRQTLASQVCSHFLFDRGGAVRRITTIFFRETDQDHG